MFKGAIFDFNGTLFWDTHLHNKAWDIYLGRYNISLTSEEKHRKLHGKNNIQLINDLFDVELSEKEVLTIAREKELIYQDLVKKDNLQLADGVIELFGYLIQNKIQFTIVTASDKLNVEFFIDYLGLDKWFDRDKIVYADGTSKPKPHPDMFLKAMHLLDLKPSETVIFEDSETGLQAAKNARAGKVIIIDSTGADYSNWDFEIVRSFHKLEKTIFA